MNPVDQLSTIAEVAVTLAGFASLVAILRSTPNRDWGLFEVLSLRELILPSLAVFLLALIPPPLIALGIEANAVFSVCGGVLAIAVAAGGFSQLRVDRGAKREGQVEPTSFVTPVQIFLYCLVIAMAAVTALGLFEERTPALYALTLVVTLAISVVAFLWFMATGLSGKDGRHR